MVVVLGKSSQVRLRRVQVKCVLEPALSATISKIFSNTTTYPIESYRLIKLVPLEKRQSDPKLQLTFSNLYRGYNLYLPYSVANYTITYNIMFNMMKSLEVLFSFELALMCASAATSIITAIYKVPSMYYLKNSVMNQCVSVKKLRGIFPRAYSVLMLEDIPEHFIKFYINHVIHAFFPYFNEFWCAIIISLLCTIIFTPVDILKNMVLCNVPFGISRVQMVLRISCTFANTFLFMFIFNILKI